MRNILEGHRNILNESFEADAMCLHQLFASWWMLRYECLIGGRFLCDDMGIGKVSESPIIELTSGWLRLAHADPNRHARLCRSV